VKGWAQLDLNRCRVGAAVAGRAGNARRRVVWAKKLAGMLAEPGPMDEPTIAGVHLRLTQAFPTPRSLTPCPAERNFEYLGAGCP
jgi:hypothetical protein